mmetsp:Transcript_7425/g.16356  ORF Transcript_7425/g.16356 Transcript_7425/m.16356 type:complete len:216 (-) Transcript_7425:1304-1951(-)
MITHGVPQRHSAYGSCFVNASAGLIHEVSLADSLAITSVVEVAHVALLVLLGLRLLWDQLLAHISIPHLVQVIPKLAATPWVHLSVKRSPLTLLVPEPNVFRICQLRAVQQAVPLQPIQRAHPPDFALGEVHELPPPVINPPCPLNSCCCVVHSNERPLPPGADQTPHRDAASGSPNRHPTMSWTCLGHSRRLCYNPSHGVGHGLFLRQHRVVVC